MKPISDMTNAELDQAIGVEVHGWNLSHIRGPNGCMYHPEDRAYRDPWMPSTDISDAFDAEAEIERMGLIAMYMKNLWTLAFRSGPDFKTHWALAHASPADRCRAILATVREAKGKT